MTVNGYESRHLPPEVRPGAGVESVTAVAADKLDGSAVTAVADQGTAHILDEGIAAVSLFNDLQAVYGPMALTE